MVFFVYYFCIIKTQKTISFTKENFEQLLGQVQQLSAQVSQLKAERNNLLDELNRLQQKHQLTKEELEWLKRQMFGRKSERYISMDPCQLTLELEGMVEAIRGQQSEQTISYQRKKPTKEQVQGHSRMPIPSHLRREEITIEPKDLPEGSKKIGEEITEVMEYKKAEIYVKKYIRPKYALPKEGGIVIEQLPSLPIPKGNAGPSLIAHILTGKYVDHLPLYRMQQQFKRLGVDISDKTIGGWVSAGIDTLSVIYDAITQEIMKSDYCMADETTIKVLDKNKKGETHLGYFWVYYSPLIHTVCFQYRKGRGRAGPREFFKNFKGAIQADGWQAYDIFRKREGVLLLACMAHVRRKFEEALKNDEIRASHALNEIQKLYAIERQAKKYDLSPEQRKELRSKESVPIMNNLKEWLYENAPQANTKILPKSKIGTAINYALGMWERLENYLLDGRYEIDNNWVENSLRPVALGRKNYLFAGSHQAAQRTAVIYSLMASCKKNEVEPTEWLTDVLQRIQDHPINKIDELFPINWKKLRQGNIK